MPDDTDPNQLKSTSTANNLDLFSATGEVDRRDFLKIAGGTIGGLALIGIVPATTAATAKATPAVPPQYYCTLPGFEPTVLGIPSEDTTAVAQSLAKFVDPLPIPAVIRPTGTYQGMALYEVEMRQFTQKLHRDLPPTTLWGYEGSYPGPTFNTEQGRPIAVHWKSKLPSTHLLPIDYTLHGSKHDVPDVRAVVHLHGAKVLSQYDGYPDAWFTKNFAQTGPGFTQEIYQYTNEQAARALWYHDHALGITRLNVYAGLAGFYLIRSPQERALNLPGGAYEIPLLIQDRTFNADGSLFYPVANIDDPTHQVPPVWVPEFFGDTIVVNGKIWPYLEVEPRKYRFRMLNGSNARFYNLTLAGQTDDAPVPPFWVIGTDSGFLPKSSKRKRVLISPAERYDVIIDFSGFKGKTIEMRNDARAPYPSGNGYIPKKVMQFRVLGATTAPDKSSLPKTLYPVPALDPAKAVKTRDINLTAKFTSLGAAMWMLNGEWDDPVTETPHAGDIEIWRIVNKGGSSHPIHLHLVQFQVLDRQPIVASNAEAVVFDGPPVRPPIEEFPAWKDTVIADARSITRVIAKFDLPKNADTTPGTRHRYVYHCHMIEHEDNEMMRPYDVIS